MKPPPFDYIEATSVDHALDLLSGGSEAKVIAGGQSLLPVLNMRLAAPELVVDIGRLDELGTITVDDAGSLVIGAAVTQTEALAHPRLQADWPLLHAAIANIGHPQIRNRGTVCGSLAHNDPAAELPAAALTLEAIGRVAGPGGMRESTADELFVGPFMTSIEPDELLLAAVFPPHPAGSGWSFREFAHRPGDFAIAGVAVLLRRGTGDGSVEGDEAGVVSEARIAAFGLASTALRLPATEHVLLGRGDPSLDDGVLATIDSELDPVDDVHASGATRRDLTKRLLAEAVAEAWRRCS